MDTTLVIGEALVQIRDFLKLPYSSQQIHEGYEALAALLAERYPRARLLAALQRSGDPPQPIGQALARAKAHQDPDLLAHILELQGLMSAQLQRRPVEEQQHTPFPGLTLDAIQTARLAVAEILVELRQARQPAEPGPAPYMGLLSYSRENAALFHGREEPVAELERRLWDSPFLALVGQAGSGKSSLLQAGLIPALAEEPSVDSATDGAWRTLITVPGEHPLTALAEDLMRLSSNESDPAVLALKMGASPETLREYLEDHLAFIAESEGSVARLLLIVDQLEELFRPFGDDRPQHREAAIAERRAYVENLVSAGIPEGPVTVLVALRADHYDRCAGYPGLHGLVSRHQVFLGPMAESALRRAIEGPLTELGWSIEPELMEQLVQDMATSSASLSLLSHALLETWRRRSGRTLTLAGYLSLGGLNAALPSSADATLFQTLNRRQRQVARELFLQLAELGRAAAETRRRIPRGRLAVQDARRADVDQVLAVLAEARLIAVDGDQVQVAQEALIRVWPILRHWLEEEEAAAATYRHLQQSALVWQREGRQQRDLYTGGRLAQAREWFDRHPTRPAAREREFLTASDAAQRRNRMLRYGAGGGVLLLVLLALVGLIALQSWRVRGRDADLEALERTVAASRQAARQQVEARETAQAHTRQAQQEAAQARAAARQARAGEWAALANLALRDGSGRQDLSLLLARQAVLATLVDDQMVTESADQALRAAVGASSWLLSLPAHRHLGPVRGVDLRPGSDQVASVSADGTLRVWSLADGRQVAGLEHDAPLEALAYRSNGEQLALGDADGRLLLWQPGTGDGPVELGRHTGAVTSVAFGPADTWVAAAGGDERVRLWPLSSDQEVRSLAGPEAPVTTLAVSPEGSRLAGGSRDGRLLVWDLGIGEVQFEAGFQDRVTDVVFGPNGLRVAAGSRDGMIRLWDATTGDVIRVWQSAHPAGVQSLAFNPDGSLLASAGADGGPDGEAVIRLWAVEDGREVAALSGHTGEVPGIAFTADGKVLVSGGQDRSVRVWRVETGELINRLASLPGTAQEALFSPDGQLVASIHQGDRGISLWRAGDGRLLRRLVGHEDAVTGIGFDEAGRLISCGADGLIQIWPDLGGSPPRTLGTVDGPITRMAYSAAGRRVAVIGGDDAWVWDTAADRLLVTVPDQGSPLERVALSVDGRRMATGGRDGTIRIWDVDSRRLLFTVRGPAEAVTALAFDVDGLFLYSGHPGESTGGDVRIWSLVTGQDAGRLPGHQGTVSQIAMAPDGQLGATVTLDGSMRIWRLSERRLLRAVLVSGSGLRSVGFSPNGEQLAAAMVGHDGEDSHVGIWDVRTWQERHTLADRAEVPQWADFGPGDRQVLAITSRGAVQLWNRDLGRLLWRWAESGEAATAAALHPDGERVALATGQGQIRLVHWQSGQVVREWTAAAGTLAALAFTPDGGHLVSAGADGRLRRWDTETVGEVLSWQAHDGPVTRLAVTEDGRRIAGVGATDQKVSVWDLESGELLAMLPHPDGRPTDVRFGQNGEQVVTAADDGLVRLWDVRSGDLLRRYGEGEGRRLSADMAPDGRHIAAAGEDGRLLLWDAETGALLRVWSEHAAPVGTARFSHDGAWLLSSGADGTIRLWIPQVMELIDLAQARTPQIGLADRRSLAPGRPAIGPMQAR